MTARAMTWFLKEVGSQANAHCIGYVPPPLSPFRFLVTQKTNFGLFFTLHRTLITQPQAGRMELLRDCLLALPNLHTLGIIDDGFTRHTEIPTVFMELKFPNIKRCKRAASRSADHTDSSRIPSILLLLCISRLHSDHMISLE